MAYQHRTISIPIRDSTEDEVIEISTDNLPDGAEVLQILRMEKASLVFWIELGLAYYRNKMYNEFVNILEISGSEASLDYQDVEIDQMKALDILAAYYVRLGHKERESKEKKKEMFGKATLLYTTADKIKMYETPHLTGRAYFCLVEGRSNKLEQADQQFNFVIKQNPNDIPAMLGKACIAFNKKDYKTALYFYKKALKQKPDGPADFRVGMGYCLARLGKYDKARLAFERALELDPENVASLCAIAILEVNTQTGEGMEFAYSALSAAYQLQHENPVVLTHLANYFFEKGDISKAEKLAWHGMNVADSDQIKAEASFQLARCMHINGNFEKAFKYYYQATSLQHPSFILPYYGLGQLHIQRAEYTQAINSFEMVLKHSPNNLETLKILGSLYAHADPDNADRLQQAREAFQKLLEQDPDDLEVLIDLAQLLEHSDPVKSLEMYQAACQTLREQEDMEPPAEMLNNMGSVQMSLGEYQSARELYEEAANKLQQDLDDGILEGSSMMYTIKYNLARCLEHLCFYDDADRLYQEIVLHKSSYVDCYLRLGCLARDRGQVYDASIYFKEAMSVSQNNADAWTLIGNLHMAKHEWGPAQKKFELILKMPEHKCDAYSLVALGNVWLETLFNPNRNRDNDSKSIEHALSTYSRALKIQPKSMWAANGIGCILAFKQEWQEARDIFAQVREVTADFFDVWVNIAHVYMETKQYVPAIQMYSNAMKKFEMEHDPTMLLYLARAFYRANKLQECRETLEKAIFEAADNIIIKFNYAIVLKKQALAVLKDMKATTEMVNGAMDDLRTAERILVYISQNKDDSLGGVRQVSRTMAGDEARECGDLLKQAQTYLARAQQQDDEENRLKAKQEEERQALRRRMEQENLEKEESIRKKLEDAKNMRHTYVQMTKDILKLPEIVEEKKSRGGGGRKKKNNEGGDEFVNDSSDMGDWQRGEGGEDGGEPRERRKKDKSSKKAARKRREKLIGEESGSEGEDRTEKRKKKSEKVEVKLSAKQSAKIKSRAFLSSDEDSSDGAAKPIIRDDDDEGGERGDSPPPQHSRITDSDDSDADSEPKPRKKKPALDSDVSNDSDDDDDMQSEPEEETPAKRKKKKAPLSEEEEEEEDDGSPVPNNATRSDSEEDSD